MREPLHRPRALPPPAGGRPRAADAGREARRRAPLRAARHPAQSRARSSRRCGINFWHFFRPEGLHTCVAVQRSLEPVAPRGQRAAGRPPAAARRCPCSSPSSPAAAPSPARSLIALWMAYYLFMIVVVFHNEIRYRSALMPFVFAGAAGGLAALRAIARAGAGSWAGVLVGAADLDRQRVRRTPRAAGARSRASARMQPALAAVDEGRIAESRALAAAAAARDPRSPRPWLDYGRRLGLARRTPPRRRRRIATALPLANFANWRAAARPRPGTTPTRARWIEQARSRVVGRGSLAGARDGLARAAAAGDGRGAARARRLRRGARLPPSARRRSRRCAPTAWNGRATSRRASCRRRARIAGPATARGCACCPTVPPPPTTSRSRWDRRSRRPLAAPVGAWSRRTTASRTRSRSAARSGRTRSASRSPPGQPLLVRIDAPTWSRIGEPADQGVRVDRMSVRPGAMNVLRGGAR